MGSRIEFNELFQDISGPGSEMSGHFGHTFLGQSVLGPKCPYLWLQWCN